MKIIDLRRMHIIFQTNTGFFDLKTGVELPNLKFRCTQLTVCFANKTQTTIKRGK